MFSKKGDLRPPFVVGPRRLYADDSEASEEQRMDMGRTQTMERIMRFAWLVGIENVLDRQWREKRRNLSTFGGGSWS
jgi:hypothetical protein